MDSCTAKLKTETRKFYGEKQGDTTGEHFPFNKSVVPTLRTNVEELETVQVGTVQKTFDNSSSQWWFLLPVMLPGI